MTIHGAETDLPIATQKVKTGEHLGLFKGPNGIVRQLVKVDINDTPDLKDGVEELKDAGYEEVQVLAATDPKTSETVATALIATRPLGTEVALVVDQDRPIAPKEVQRFTGVALKLVKPDETQARLHPSDSNLKREDLDHVAGRARDGRYVFVEAGFGRFNPGIPAA